MENFAVSSRIVPDASELGAAEGTLLPLPPTRPKLTLRRPDEILAMEFDDSDLILGDRLLAKGQPLTILGAGGVGKSRLLLQLAVCTITGREFIGFVTRGRDLRWLILQGENSNRRLKFDLEHLKAWVGLSWAQVNEQLLIHTLETDQDGFLDLENPSNFTRMSEPILDFKPNIVGFDTLNNFGIGDLNKDADMRETCQTISRLVKQGDPDRGIAVLHHAITGKMGAAKATGYDRASFGRNSKVLQAWTRGQINLAAGKPDSNDSLVVSCGKCSNGKEFPDFAIKLNPETMLYEPDPSFDLETWAVDIGVGKTGTKVPLELAAELCRGAMEKKALARAIMDRTGCCRAYAYKRIDAAEKCGLIHWTIQTETYVRKT